MLIGFFVVYNPLDVSACIAQLKAYMKTPEEWTTEQDVSLVAQLIQPGFLPAIVLSRETNYLGYAGLSQLIEKNEPVKDAMTSCLAHEDWVVSVVAVDLLGPYSGEDKIRQALVERLNDSDLDSFVKNSILYILESPSPPQKTVYPENRLESKDAIAGLRAYASNPETRTTEQETALVTSLLEPGVLESMLFYHLDQEGDFDALGELAEKHQSLQDQLIKILRTSENSIVQKKIVAIIFPNQDQTYEINKALRESAYYAQHSKVYEEAQLAWKIRKAHYM
jgi:hypothetical protein